MGRMRIYNNKEITATNKVVFLTINWRKDKAFYAVDTSSPPVCFPLEWGYLTNGKYKSIILDEYYHNRKIEETLELISSINPDTILISTTPSYLFWRCPPLNIDLIFEYINQIKLFNSSIIVITIGPHGTVDPKWIFCNSETDYVFRGEPDGNLNRFLENKNYEESNWLSCRNHYKKIAPQQNFDSIGSCDYSYIQSKNYDFHLWGIEKQLLVRHQINRFPAMVELTRGCPYNCPYCFRTGFRNKFRKKSLEMFERELLQLSKLNVGYVYFIDETFGIDWQLFEKACKIICDLGIKFGLQSRPDTLNPERLYRLKKLGCIYIEFGLESNEKTSNECLGKFADIDTAKGNIDVAKSFIDFVNVNIFDLINSDYMEKISTCSQFDNEGNTPPPLIPYPTTPFGEKSIYNYQHLFPDMSKWELAELIFLYYSYKAGLISELIITDNKNVSNTLKEILVHKKSFIQLKENMHKTRFQRLFHYNYL